MIMTDGGRNCQRREPQGTFETVTLSESKDRFSCTVPESRSFAQGDSYKDDSFKKGASSQSAGAYEDVAE
jgi:hypothetical protein